MTDVDFAMTDTLSPGSEITVTITTAPTRPDDVETLRRLMRMTAPAQRALARAHKVRGRTTPEHQRGGRTWKVRPKVPLFVNPTPGASWTMRYRPQIAPDIASVREFIRIEPA
jgi:hypothetical protein